MLPYACTVFLSAFLLLAVQPLIAKSILPRFGGTPALWTTCLVFFQAVLLGGYGYSRLVAARPTLREQAKLHACLLMASLVLLASAGLVWPSPITPVIGGRPLSSEDPTWRILGLLTISVGLPYFVLSSTGPLLQSWFSRANRRGSPYRLYALSNLGSLLALASYPFLVEPVMTLESQGRVWAAVYFAFALCCGYCSLWTAKCVESASALDPSTSTNHVHTEPDDSRRPGWKRYWIWLSLAACPSVMLLATTNQMCQEVAVVPLLWVLPLGLYLLSFILCFENARLYRRGGFHVAFGLGILATTYALYRGPVSSTLAEIGPYSFGLFTCCMVCHGELARLKPSSLHLTDFYLMVATGGVIGGIFVALLAPRVFRGFWELHVGLWGSAFVVFMVLVHDEASWLYHRKPIVPIFVLVCACLLPQFAAFVVRGQGFFRGWRDSLIVFVALALVVKVLLRKQRTETDPGRHSLARVCGGSTLAMLGLVLFYNARGDALKTWRNFYGVLSVVEVQPSDPDEHHFVLVHGPIVHGLQFVSEAKRHLTTAYYGPRSGVGLALLNHPRRRGARKDQGPLRIGVVGLGVGTLAAYAREGDSLRFYEINPRVVKLAEGKYFSYLRDCPARIEIVLGDARLSMEDELARNEPQEFDVLALDAFSGGAIPIHLLTKEAFETYLRHLRRPDGILAVHITNRYLDLRLVIWAAADHFRLAAASIHSDREGSVCLPSEWILLARDGQVFDCAAMAKAITPREKNVTPVRLWTDDYSNLIQILR